MLMKSVLTIPILALVLGGAACTSDDDLVTPTPQQGPPPVTDTFTGTLTQNGATTEPFSVSAAGGVVATIAKLEPDATVIVGLSIGTWNGSTCQTIISNDRATQGVSVAGTADRAGRLCMRIYDAAGTLPAPTTYEVNVVHP